MAIPETLRSAAGAADPAAALRLAVQNLQAARHTRAEVSGWLNELLLQVRAEAPESAAEDAILGTLDAVEGWCHPSARLFPESTA